MKTRIGVRKIVLGLLIVGVVWGYLQHRRTYPFGMSHCCIQALAFALKQYASDHDGHFPAGESSPEASFSLLHKSSPELDFALRGMIIPEDTVRKVLASGQLLSPETCGWRYVEGLTDADDPELAILWCKEALGHNGQRTSDVGRQVVRVNGVVDWISGREWDHFLERQKQLMEARTESARKGLPLVDGYIEMPDHTQVQKAPGSYTIQERFSGADSTGSEASSSSAEDRSAMIWMRAPTRDGCVTRTLSFTDLVSDPVTVCFKDGVPDHPWVIYRMKPRESLPKQ